MSEALILPAVHVVWNFWCGGGPTVDGPLQQWVSANGATIVLARTDWEVVEDVFSWGYARGLKLMSSGQLDPKTNVSIGASNGQCTDIQFDAVDIGVEVLATDPVSFWHIYHHHHHHLHHHHHIITSSSSSSSSSFSSSSFSSSSSHQHISIIIIIIIIITSSLHHHYIIIIIYLTELPAPDH